MNLRSTKEENLYFPNYLIFSEKNNSLTYSHNHDNILKTCHFGYIHASINEVQNSTKQKIASFYSYYEDKKTIRGFIDINSDYVYILEKVKEIKENETYVCLNYNLPESFVFFKFIGDEFFILSYSFNNYKNWIKIEENKNYKKIINSEVLYTFRKYRTTNIFNIRNL